MTKITKFLIPIIATLAISITASNLKFDGGCTCHAPIILLGSLFGCGGEKSAETVKPAVPDASGINPIVASADNNTDTKNASKGLKVTFIELGSVNCIPCKMMQPVMRQIEGKYKGQVKVVFHDVWTPAGRPYAQQYGIRGIPTQVFLDKNGKEYSRHVGFFPFNEVEKILKNGGVR